MAVIYSKLGDCLRVTTKLDPLARTDLWAGVKGLLERLMTHLGLGSSLEDPWGSLLGVVVVRLSSREIELFSWEAWGALCLIDHLKPCLTDLAWLLGWPAWGNCYLPQREVSSGLRNTASFPQEEGERWPGKGCFLHPRKVSNCWRRIASFTGGRWAIAWEQLLPSLEGRRMPAWLPAGGELLPSPGWRSAIAWEILLTSPEGRRAVAWEELLPLPEGRWAVAWRVPAWLLAWYKLLLSPEGRRVPACLFEMDCCLPWGEVSTSLSACLWS